LKKKFTSKKAIFQIFGHKKRLSQKSEKTTQNKKCFKLSEVMVGSGIRKKPIPDPGSGGQKGTGSRIRIRNTGLKVHMLLIYHILYARYIFKRVLHTTCIVAYHGAKKGFFYEKQQFEEGKGQRCIAMFIKWPSYSVPNSVRDTLAHLHQFYSRSQGATYSFFGLKLLKLYLVWVVCPVHTSHVGRLHGPRVLS
jgi:hypothetical protein